MAGQPQVREYQARSFGVHLSPDKQRFFLEVDATDGTTLRLWFPSRQIEVVLAGVTALYDTLKETAAHTHHKSDPTKH